MWTGLGWVASSRASRALPLIETYRLYVVAAAVALMVLAGVWRVHKVRLHKGLHVRDGRER